MQQTRQPWRRHGVACAALAALLGSTAPAQAADRWWTFIGGCANADWLGTLGGANAQGRFSCWAAQGGGLSGQTAPGILDDVYIVNPVATGTLLVSFAAASRPPDFVAHARDMLFAGSAAAAVGLDVGRGTLNAGSIQVGNPSQLGTTLGQLDVSGGTVQTPFLTLRAGSVNLSSGLLDLGQMLLEPNGNANGALVQTGGRLSAAGLRLSGGDIGAATVHATAGSATVSSLVLDTRNSSQASHVLLEGFFTRWNVGSLDLGAQSLAYLTLNDKAGLETTTSTLGAGGFGNGIVRLDTQASWAAGALTVGDFGQATVQAAGGATLRSDNAVLGYSQLGNGEVKLSGVGTGWTDSGKVTIARGGFGKAQVLAGAQVLSDSLAVGSGSFSNGLLEVDGAGSVWRSTHDISIGALDLGQIRLSDAGRLFAESMMLGRSEGGDGRLDASGANTSIVIDGLVQIGRLGSARFSLGDGATMKAGGVAVGAHGALHLAGGELETASLTRSAGAHFDWTAGTVHFTGTAGAALGDGLPAALTLNGTQLLRVDETLRLPAGSTLLLDGGGLSARRLVVDGGVVAGSPQGVLNSVKFQAIEARGTLAVAVAGERGQATTITATGPLLLGQLDRTDGFEFHGQLDLAGHQVVLHDADQALLGGRVTLGPGGQLVTVNGARLLAGAVLESNGGASILGRFENQGSVHAAAGALTFFGDVEGSGSFEGAIVFRAGFAPGGRGTAQLDFGGSDLGFGPQGVLELDLSTLQAQGADLLAGIETLAWDGSLVLNLAPGFVAQAGERVDLLDFRHFSGHFDPARVTVNGVAASALDFSRFAEDGTVGFATAVELPPVPEPGRAATALAGLLGLAWWRRRWTAAAPA